MRHSAVFIIACLLSVLSASLAATPIYSGLISYNGLILTSNGDGNQVTLVPQGICQKTQEWVYDSDGYIYQKSNSTLVLDVKDSNTLNGATVIMWIKKPSNVDTRNQQWNVNTSAPYIQSRLTGATWAIRKSSTSNGVVNSNNSPLQGFQFVQPQYPCPATCQSHGDPHFTAWTGRRFDFQSANTVLLANFSGALVYTVQFACNTGVTCNEGFVVQPAGTNQTFQLTYSQAYINRTAISLAVGTTSFSSFINVTKWSNTLYTIYVPGGYISYGIYTWYRGKYANVDVTITNGYPGPSLCMGPAAGQNQHTFGSQYLVSAANQTAYVYGQNPFSYNPNFVPNYNPTTNDTNLINNATTICNMLTQGLYAACNALVDPTPYIGSCYNDTIAMMSTEFARSSFDEYARQCAEAATRNGTNITLPTTSIATIVINVVFSVPQNTVANFTIVSKDITFKNRSTGGDNFVITATGPANLTFTVTDNMDGTYTVFYNPVVEGSYNFTVKLNGTDEVSGSPFTVNVFAVTNATTTSFVFGPVPVNTSQNITIQARTSSGSNRTAGGDSFTYSLTNGNVTAVTDNMDGTYTFTYVATSTGAQQLSINYMGTPIACSPYTVIVK